MFLLFVKTVLTFSRIIDDENQKIQYKNLILCYFTWLHNLFFFYVLSGCRAKCKKMADWKISFDQQRKLSNLVFHFQPSFWIFIVKNENIGNHM